MNFSLVVEALQRGETVRRKSWREGEYLRAITMHQGLPPDFLMLLDVHSRRHWSPTMRDLLAEDWVIEVIPSELLHQDRRSPVK